MPAAHNPRESARLGLRRRWEAAAEPAFTVTPFKCPRDREKMHSLAYAELKRRVEDGMLGQPGESQAVYDARVRADRLARGVELGEYFTNPSAFSGTHLPYCTCAHTTVKWPRPQFRD